jgi:hypothetical protein
MSIGQRLCILLLGAVVLGVVCSCASLPASAPPVAMAPKAFLFEEDRNNPTGNRYDGSVSWRNEGVAITADIEIPDQRMSVQFTLRRNNDKRLPASHTVEIRFKLPADFSHRGVAEVPGLLMKAKVIQRGEPLFGHAFKVATNFFTVALAEADVQRNVRLLKDRSWFDIPVVYEDGKRSIITIEKGSPGERAFSEAFAASDSDPERNP